MQDDGVTPYRTLSVATTLPDADDENMVFYRTVYANGDGTYDIYNCGTYYSITYSPTYNNWEIYDPYESDFSNLFPYLVKADNPVAEPEPTPGEGLAHPFTSNIAWTVDENLKSYDHTATINGTEDVNVLKLGTGSVVGSATVVIPAGTAKIGFYAVAWKGKKGTLLIQSQHRMRQTIMSLT